MTKKNDRRLDDLLNTISQGSHPKNSDDINFLDIVNDKIYTELRGVLEILKSDRSYVFLYHNGGISSSGLYFQRMSCICEVVSEGVLPVSGQYQNIHKGAYSQVCKSLRDSGQYFVPDAEELTVSDSFVYQVARSRHTPSFYFQALRDSQNNVIGFVGVDYCSYNDNTGDEFIAKVLKSTSLKISSLVDVRSEVVN